MSELRERVRQARGILGQLGHTSITLDDEHNYTVENLFDDLLREMEGESEAKEPIEVVCLCGSTRFADQHAIRRWELEQEGQGRVVVLMINYLPHWWADAQGWDGNDHFGERTGTKEMLDELHLRKIDLSDRVEVVNPGGYVGESTANEINYAVATGKPVTFMDDHLYGPGVKSLKRQPVLPALSQPEPEPADE